jgi:hypothetical protein
VAMNVERGSNWVTISNSPREAAANRRTSAGQTAFDNTVMASSNVHSWSAGCCSSVVLLPVCALLYGYGVPLTSSPVRDADGNPRFR